MIPSHTDTNTVTALLWIILHLLHLWCIHSAIILFMSIFPMLLGSYAFDTLLRQGVGLPSK